MTTWQPTHPRRLQPQLSDPMNTDRTGNLHTHADCNLLRLRSAPPRTLATYTPTQIATFHRRRNQMSYPLATYTPTQIATAVMVVNLNCKWLATYTPTQIATAKYCNIAVFM